MSYSLVLYGCEFVAHTHASIIEAELLWSWLWSMFQRWALTEPLLILTVRVMPLLLKSKACLACCNENVVKCVELVVETVVKMGRALTAV